jgi:hypothetical protein
MTAQQPDIEATLLAEHARRQQPKRLPSLNATTRNFERVAEDRYRLTISELAITLEIDRLRRERGELTGEFTAICKLPGTMAADGILSIADLNLSSARTRQDRAKLLATRANTRDGLDWFGVMEGFCQAVLAAEKQGEPAVDLRTIARPAADSEIVAGGFPVLRRHPLILFGDGGVAKSYFALWIGGLLVEQGLRVAYFDWELSPEDHRDRLERLFSDGMPRISYARCVRPLVYEVSRLSRIVRDEGIDFAIFDSVAFAADGPPEAAEVAGRYFRAVRQIGGGSLHIAHITKGENADKRPFGSTFWHNGARSTWFVQKSEGAATADASLQIGVFNRKSNLGRLHQPLGFRLDFEDERTLVRRIEVADNAELAGQLSVRQRMTHLLRRGAMTPEAIAEEIEAEPETIKRTVRRYKSLFTVIDGGRVGLLERGCQ